MSGFDRDRFAGQAPGFASRVLGLSSEAFVLLRDLVGERTGVYFDNSRRDVFADKMAELIVERGLTSFLDYYYLLRYDADAERYWLELRDRLAVPETYFWRQPEQLESLAQHVVPAYYRSRHAPPLRIWSAACCTGEEPLSIAIALAEAGWLEREPIRILASDASPALLERARTGVFRERAFRSLPERLRDRYFEPGSGGWRIDPDLLGRVEWQTANLVERTEVSELAASQVIFCRNVFIYFSDDAIRRVTGHFYERMPAPGYLFLGASESLARLGTPFELEEIGNAFVYMKPSPGERRAEVTAPREAAPWRRAPAHPQEQP